MQPSQDSSPETVEVTNQATDPKPEKSQIQSLADMFRDDDPPEQGGAPESGAHGEPAEKHKGKPKGLKEAAERLQLKPEDLYSIEVPMADGKVKTLGQLKDLAAKEGDISVRELRFEEDRSRKESDLLRSQNELRELVSALPQNAIKPEVLDAIRQKHESNLKRERAQTLEAIPEWRDETRRTEEIAGIVEHLEGYGFPKGYLNSVYDHRTIKYMRENMLREQRIRKALELVETVAPSKTKSSGKPNGAAPKPTASTRKFSDSRSRLLNFLG